MFCSHLGAWTIHGVCIILLKLLFDIVPGVSQEMSWTLVNITYMCASYLMFHWVRGVPFDFNAGAYDNLNMWEQIDNGDQYTPSKKFLLMVPIVLFLLSTHYTHYDLTYFIINFLAVLLVVIPKLPFVSQADPEPITERANSDFAEPSDAGGIILWGARRLTRCGGAVMALGIEGGKMDQKGCRKHCHYGYLQARLNNLATLHMTWPFNLRFMHTLALA